uniref:Uncharacterized protein n=1 Tax=Amphimedon queenslandica TaxID=400682 RepID=A0A1X7U728_AMPQE
MADLTPVSDLPHLPSSENNPPDDVSNFKLKDDNLSTRDEQLEEEEEEEEEDNFESDDLRNFEGLDLEDDPVNDYNEESVNFELGDQLNFAVDDPVNYEHIEYLPIEDSTTEDQETLPGESTTTTDAGGYHDDQALQNGGRVTDTRYQTETVFISSSRAVGGVHSYENWPIFLGLGDETGKRKRNLTRFKGSRAPIIRQRPPQPLPRGANKVKTPRPPAPLPRKRRIPIKPRPPQGMVTSEGDMAQADETGDEEGRSDDGFVEGNDPGGSGRRRKKRQPVLIGVIILTYIDITGNKMSSIIKTVKGIAPILSTAVSPPSSPSNTPLSARRRTTASRKGRTKPRHKRQSKPSVPASADISTQETTTTPGPGSSETDDNELGVVEEVELVPNGNLATPIHKLVVEEEEEETAEMSARIVHKTTPPSVSRSSPTTYTNRPPSSVASKATPTTGRGTQIGANSVTKTRPNLGGKRQVGGARVFDKESNNESQTSDTEMTSTSALSLSSQKGTGAGGGRRKFDSDLSTAPFSSETSDMSEGERGLGRKGSPPPDPSSSSIPRPSPKLSRKAISVDATQTDVKAEATPSKVEATPTAKGSARPVKAGNFVSKRTSVLAMISQFDGGPNKKPDNEGTGSARVPPPRPHPPAKSALSAKPNPRPKPPGMTNKQPSPPRATPTKTTPIKTTPTEGGANGNGEKKGDKPPKVVNSRLSSVASGGRAKSSTDCTSGDSSSSHNEGGGVSGRSSGGSGNKLSTSKASTSTANTVSKGHDTLKSLKGNDADSKSDTKSIASNDSDETKSTDGSVGGASKQAGGANKPARPVPPRGIKRPTTTTTSSTNRLSAVKTTPTSGRSSPVASSNVGGASAGAKLKGTDDIQLLGNKVKPNGGGGAVGGVKRTRPSFSSRTGPGDKSTTPTLTKNSISLPVIINDSKDNLGSKSPPVPVERKSPPTPVEKKVLPTADKKVPPTPTEKAPPTPSNKKPPLTPIDKKPPIVERKNPLISKLSTDKKSPPVEKKAVPTTDKKSEAPSDKEGEESATKELLEKSHSIRRATPRRPPPEPPTLSPPPDPKSPPVVRKVSSPTNKSSVAPPLPPPFKSISPKATPPTLPSQRAPPPTPVGQKPSLQKATPPSQKPPPRPPKLSDSKDQAQNYEEFVPTLHRSSSISSQTGPPSPAPLSPNESHYEGVSITPTFTIGNTSIKKSSQSSDVETPPPLPPRNYAPDDNLIPRVISLPVALTTVDERDGPTTPTSVGPFPSLDDAPPPLPTQPIPKRKSLLSHMPSPPSCSPLLKRKEIPASLIRTSPTLPSRFTPPTNRINIYEEINIGPSPFRSRSSSASSSFKTIEQHYEVSDSYRHDSPKARAGLVRTSSSGSGSTTSSEDPRRFSASICVTNSLGVSPVSVRRANSDSKSQKVSIVVTGTGDEPQRRSSIQRTSSMDALDERKQPRASLTDPGYSSGEEEDLSLRNAVGLPQLPKNLTMPLKRESSKQDPEEEPLYQYINHADFSSTNLSFPSDKSQTVPAAGKGSNQLEIARQLSINHRKLWCEQPEVIRSGVLGVISDQDRKLQEAMYEVLTSEASYLRSLNVLIEHFMEDPGMNPNLPEGRRVLDKRQHHVMFSNVRDVREAEGEFNCYVPYCTNQVYQMRELTSLLETNVMFQDYLKRLEADKRCQNLSMTSFLLLPMQRITRLPLLILAILNRTPMDNPNHPIVEKSLRAVQKLVTACNDGARQMERTEELHLIHKQLEFFKMKPFPLVSVSRQLERKGPLAILQVEQRLFGKPKIRRIPVHVFAFTDYVLITKKKTNPKTNAITYRVLDYASKAVLETIDKLKVLPNVTYPKHVFGEQETVAKATWAVSMAEEHHAFLLIFLENSCQKSEKYIMISQNETDQTRWLEALTHPAKEKQKEDEKIYETWDCPQVQAVYDYTPKQHDELGLMRGDIVKVYRKMADGWYEGERMRDLQWGWFPSNFTTEIENAHTRARNLKERHRLLSLPFNPDDFLTHFNATS